MHFLFIHATTPRPSVGEHGAMMAGTVVVNVSTMLAALLAHPGSGQLLVSPQLRAAAARAAPRLVATDDSSVLWTDEQVVSRQCSVRT